MRRILLSLALVAMFVTAAHADTYVWWTLDGSNCNAYATDSGKGKALLIEKPLVAPAGFYEFTLTMHMTNDAGSTQGLTQERTSLWKNATDTATFSSDPVTSNLDAMAAEGGWATTYNTVNQGQQIFQDYGRMTASGTPKFNSTSGERNWIQFTLRIPEGSEAFSTTHNYYHVPGQHAFAMTPPTTAGRRVYFGSNPAVSGNLTTYDTWAIAGATLPVIVIHAIPEPATLALFGLGLLGLIRRR